MVPRGFSPTSLSSSKRYTHPSGLLGVGQRGLGVFWVTLILYLKFHKFHVTFQPNLDTMPVLLPSPMSFVFSRRWHSKIFKNVSLSRGAVIIWSLETGHNHLFEHPIPSGLGTTLETPNL